MKDKVYHIISNYKDGWDVVKQGNKKATLSFYYRDIAISYAKSINHIDKIIVHDETGEVDHYITMIKNKYNT